VIGSEEAGREVKICLNIQNLLIKLKAYNIVVIFTIFYWTFALSAVLLLPLYMLGGPLRFIHTQLMMIATLMNIINIILLIAMLCCKVGKLKSNLIMLGINGLTAVIGPFFIGFPIMMM
jgi:hypothetical protein